LWTVTDSSRLVHASSGLALGDIDLDGRLEVIGQDTNGGMIAFEHDGAFKWRSPPIGLGGQTLGSPSLADLDGDGIPEVVVGATVLNNDGTVRWQGANSNDTGNNGFGPLSVIADLDLDGKPEILTGRSAFRADGTFYWTSSLSDGFTAVGNFDLDPFPEIVHVANGDVRLLEHTGAVKWGPVAIPLGGRGGPPTIADVDADGEPEIGVAGSARYVMLESNGTIKWQTMIQDGSSNVTGSSVFDFEGDGSAEVVYGDELFLRIYRGSDGMELYRLARGSATLHEIPTIVDVDGDGRAEIVAGANNWRFGSETGLYVIGAAQDNWVPTRAIWNQHTYHVTNITADGRVPAVEPHHWLLPGLNAFRENAFAPGDPDRFTSFTYRVSDGTLESNDAVVRIKLRQPNSAPSIQTEAVTAAATGLEYLYGVAISDPDRGDSHTFELLVAPAGMTIDPLTGLVRWTPLSAQLGAHAVTVRVLDRGGLFDHQTYSITVSAPVVVPDLIGRHQDEAPAELVGRGLAVGLVSTAYSSLVPASHIVLQSPPAGTLVAPDTAVSYQTSSGPEPITVPSVLGLAEDAAQARLTSSGLAVGTIAQASSAEVAPGRVIVQSPAAGTIVTATSLVDLTISTGAAVAVALERAILPAGSSTVFVIEAFDNTGSPVVPLPPLTLSILADPGESVGTPPSIAGNLVVTAADTRGTFTLRAVLQATGDTAAATFVVSRPSGDGWGHYAKLGAAIDAIRRDVRALEEAIAISDLAAIPRLHAALAATAATIDVTALQRTPAFAPEGGFPPTAVELTSAGFPETAADVAWNTTLRQLVAKMAETETFLTQLTPAGAQNDDSRLQQLNAEMSALAAALNGLSPSVHGVVKRVSVIQQLVGVRIPRLLHAQIDLIARTLQAQGLARLQQPLDRYYAGLVASGDGLFSPGRFYARRQATFFSLVSMMSASSIRSDIIDSVYMPVIKQLIKAGVILAGNSLLRTFANAGSLVSVITASSQSFHFFEIPGSVIEGFGFDRDFPEGNEVILVGPGTLDAVLDLLGSFTDTDFDDLLDLGDKFAEIIETADGVGGTYFDEGNLYPDSVVRGCVFDFDTACSELVYDAGLLSVHETEDPGAFPAPVLIIVRNVTTGAWGTLVASFFPTLEEP
jgi:hypothetical protein